MTEAVSKGVLLQRVRKKREKELKERSDPDTFFEDAQELSLRLSLVTGELIRRKVKSKIWDKLDMADGQLMTYQRNQVKRRLIYEMLQGLQVHCPELLEIMQSMKDGEFSPLELSPKQDKVRKAILTEQDIKRFGSRRCESCCKAIDALQPVVYAVNDAKNRIWHAACAVTEAPVKTTLRKYVVLERHIEKHGVQDCRVCNKPMVLGTEVSWKVGSTPTHLACQEPEDSAETA